MWSQVTSLAFALVLMWIVANIPPQTIARAAVPLYALGIVLLAAVALWGVSVNGSRRWLNLGVGRFQPSELMKVALPLMLAWYFQKFEGRIGWKDFVLAVGADRRAGLSHQAPARSRHGAPDRRVGLLRALLRRPVVESHRRPRRGGGRRRAARLAASARLSARADPDVHRPGPRPARRGLSLVAGVDRAGLGRRGRQGLVERHADAPRLPAGAAHRLHLRGVRRGIRPDRQRGAARPLPAPGRARAHDHGGRVDAVRAAHRRRDDADVLHLRVREHGHGERRAAGGRRAAAARVLRRHGAHLALHRARHPDERAGAPEAREHASRACSSGE